MTNFAKLLAAKLFIPAVVLGIADVERKHGVKGSAAHVSFARANAQYNRAVRTTFKLDRKIWHACDSNQLGVTL